MLRFQTASVKTHASTTSTAASPAENNPALAACGHRSAAFRYSPTTFAINLYTAKSVAIRQVRLAPSQYTANSVRMQPYICRLRYPAARRMPNIRCRCSSVPYSTENREMSTNPPSVTARMP